MRHRTYKGTPRRTRSNRIHWPHVQSQLEERGISNRLLAESLGVRPPYVSRLNREADSDPDRCVMLSTHQVSRLREMGIALEVLSCSRLDDALGRMWEALLALPCRHVGAEAVRNALISFSWSSLIVEIDARLTCRAMAAELPAYLSRLRTMVGIARWDEVAQSIGVGFMQVTQRNKLALTTRELVVRLLEQDLRHPLICLPPTWEHVIIAGESPFAGLHSLAARSHVEGRGCQVRVALDAWPGYFPLWAVRDELRAHGIAILFIEDSATKKRLLIDGQVDVIGTTPGGLALGEASENLPRLEILAVLNRSIGADQVLQRPRVRPTRNPAQKPRAAVTGGSTSELLLRVFARTCVDGQAIQPVAVRGYVSAAQLLLQDHLVEYVSTWEPYSELLRDMVPDLQVVASTSPHGLDLVADYLVSVRERTGRPLRDSMAVLLEVWNRVINGREYLDSAFLESISRQCAVSMSACRRMLSMVEFYTTREMAWRLQQGTLMDQFKDVSKVAGASREESARRWNLLVDPTLPWFSPRSA